MSAISQINDGGVLINIRLVPRASKNEISGELNGALKIRLQAPPVDGKANKALIGFLSELLGVSKSSITIQSGETGRNKRIAIDGIDLAEVRRRLIGQEKVPES